jgi:hypothetical protein
MTGAIEKALCEIIEDFVKHKAPREAINRAKTLRAKYKVVQQTLF